MPILPTSVCTLSHIAWLEIDYERSDEQDATDHTEPERSLEEVGIDAQQDAGKHGDQFRLPFSVNEVRHSENACDKSDYETIHLKLPVAAGPARMP